MNRDLYFMELAKVTSIRSKDPNTKVGACISKNKKVLSLGYNGAPRNIPDLLVPLNCRDKTKPLKEQKYPYIIHAEVNAILNYGGSLEDLKGSSIYVTSFPCYECAKIIIQSGIKNVYYLKDYGTTEGIEEMSKYLFDLANVKYKKVEENEIDYI